MSLLSSPSTLDLFLSNQPLFQSLLDGVGVNAFTPGERLTVGLSAIGRTDYARMFSRFEAARRFHYGWDDRAGWRAAEGYDDGLTRLLSFMDPTGEGATIYFAYDVRRDQFMADGEDCEATVYDQLTYHLDIGRPCGHEHDCCACWFNHGLHLWRASTDDLARWYGVYRRSMNV